MTIRGILDASDDEDEDDEEEEDGGHKEPSEAARAKQASYTTEQMDYTRAIFITTRRDELLQQAEVDVLGDQAGQDFRMFTTRFSYEVQAVLKSLLVRVAKQTPDLAFDTLFAYTFQLYGNDVWTYDNEGLDPALFKRFGKAWAKLLAHSDEELGIDSEYTRPGIVELLSQFKQQLDEHENSFEPRMKWKFT